MQRDDYLKDYYKSLEEAPHNILEEYEGGVLSVMGDYKAVGDEKKVKELEVDLERVRQLMKLRREK